VKLLIVPYYFAPLSGPRSIRWTNISRCFADEGHSVDIIAADIPADIVFHDHSLMGISQHENITIHSIPISSRTTRNPQNLLWSFRAIRQSLSLFTDFDAVITSALPIWSHLIGYLLKMKKASGIWIADYGDPWSLSEARKRPKFIRWLEFHFEKMLVSKADHLTITTSQAKPLFAELYPKLEAIKVIPQGASRFHMTTEWTNRSSENRLGLNILYCGGFYGKLRDPSALFKAMQHVANVKITIVGEHKIDIRKMIKAQHLEDKIIILEPVELEEIVRLQTQSDILLIYSNTSRYQIPGKIYEYLATNKPILYISEAVDDEISLILRTHRAGYVCRNEETAIQDQLIYLTRKYNAGQLLKRHPAQDVGFNQRALAFIQLIRGLNA
jgi:hypothetical protein